MNAKGCKIMSQIIINSIAIAQPLLHNGHMKISREPMTPGIIRPISMVAGLSLSKRLLPASQSLVVKTKN